MNIHQHIRGNAKRAIEAIFVEQEPACVFKIADDNGMADGERLMNSHYKIVIIL